ncbi:MULTISPECIES: transposase [Streptomyces]|uniref:transposase n=2 Tax=Streptomyces TaxID=1883 RepID=UPI0027D21EB1|nr:MULTISPECIES: transposase [Streptomyces]
MPAGAGQGASSPRCPVGPGSWFGESQAGRRAPGHLIAPVEFNSAAPTCDCVAHRFGNAADHQERVRRYPSDMTDAEWAVVRPLLPVPGWLRGRGGQPEAYCHRAMLDAIRYLVDNGIKSRAMPGTSRCGSGSMRSSVAGVTMVWSGSSTTGCAPGSESGWAGMRSRRPR